MIPASVERCEVGITDRCGASDLSKPKFTFCQGLAGCSGTHTASPRHNGIRSWSVGREGIWLSPASQDQQPTESDLPCLQAFWCEKIRNFGLKQWGLATESTCLKVPRLRKICDKNWEFMALQRPSKAGICLCNISLHKREDANGLDAVS